MRPNNKTLVYSFRQSAQNQTTTNFSFFNIDHHNQDILHNPWCHALFYVVSSFLLFCLTYLIKKSFKACFESVMQYDDDLEEIFNEYQKSARKISKTYSKMEKSVAHSQQCKEQYLYAVNKTFEGECRNLFGKFEKNESNFSMTSRTEEILKWKNPRTTTKFSKNSSKVTPKNPEQKIGHS